MVGVTPVQPYSAGPKSVSTPWLRATDHVLFSESGGPSEPLPRWAADFIELGFRLPIAAVPRRIIFVSTPCESAAAGLITLGAMLKRLEQENADDLSAHYVRLQALTPETARGVILRHRIRTKRRFEVVRNESGRIQFQECGRRDPERYTLLEPHASNWYFDGEPPVEGYRGVELPHVRLYEALMPPGHHLFRKNLQRTDSHVVLAGRSGGRTLTEQILSAIRLRSGDEANLSELLAIHGWQPRNVSRVRYFNPRTGTGEPFDRPGPPAGIVVADGPGTFLTVVDHPEIQNSSVLAVIPRTADPDQLDAVATRVESLGQWYDADPETGTDLPSLPAGVEIATLRRGG